MNKRVLSIILVISMVLLGGFGFVGCKNDSHVDTIVEKEIETTSAPSTVEAPQASLATGSYLGTKTVNLSCATEGAEIRYTLDGTEPSETSALYEGAITIQEDTVLKALAYKAEMTPSSILSFQYTIKNFGLSRDHISLSLGDAMVVSALFQDINDKSELPVIFESDQPQIVTVDQELGMIKAVAPGQATITATIVATGEVAQCSVNVSEECTTFYYVSTEGNDQSDGTERTPFKTVEKARDTIRALDRIPAGGITVYLRGGKYYVNESIVFTPEDSGREGAPIVYASYPGEAAVIHSGKQITGFTKLTENYPTGLPEIAKGNVFVADVTPGWRFHDIYVGGKRQQVARQYNTQELSKWSRFWGEVISPTKQADAAEKGMLINFSQGELEDLPNNGDLEVYLLPVIWWNSLPVVTDLDPANNQARLQSFNPSIDPNYNFGGLLFQHGGKYNFMNAPKFIDEPGEWCIDSTNGKLYFWPENSKDINDVIAPYSTELIRLQGDGEQQNWEKQVAYIEFRNLEFAYTDRLGEDQWSDTKKEPDLLVRNAENPFAAIFMQGATNCAVINSIVNHTGTYAIAIDQYAQNNRVVQNKLEDLGCGGVQIYGYGPGNIDVNYRNTVLGNDIHDLGKAPYQHSAAITIYGSGYNDVKFNRIANVPYTATMIAGADGDSLNKKHFNQRAFTDTYGNINTQYGIRQDEISAIKGSDKWDTFKDEGQSVMPYQHSDYNVFEYNMAYEYMLDMDDGGTYYGWAGGYNNEYNFNTAYKSVTGKGTINPLYSDNYFNFVRWEGNVVWAPQIAVRQTGLSNLWKNNTTSTTQTQAYTDLTDKINTIVEKELGGWKKTE